MRQEKATKQRKRTVNVFGYAILSEQTAINIATSQKLENHKVTFKKMHNFNYKHQKNKFHVE